MGVDAVGAVCRAGKQTIINFDLQKLGVRAQRAAQLGAIHIFTRAPNFDVEDYWFTSLKV